MTLRQQSKHVLTRQQAHILREFGNPDDPYQQSSETLSYCGVREWPTCDNLVSMGLLARLSWDRHDGGWLYALTDTGRNVLRELRA